MFEVLGLDSGPLEPPIRAEIFGQERFAQHGRSLGQTHRAAPAPSSRPTFFPRLRENVGKLRRAHLYIGEQASTGYDISPAAEWLLDNFHLIEAQLDEVRGGLPRSYFSGLPVLIDAPLAGLPRIYGVAWAFVAHTDGAFDERLLEGFLNAYQETRQLTLGELWALPTTLRVVLIENLRRLAERVASNKAARELANACADDVQAIPMAELEALRGALQRRGVAAAFLAQLAQRLRGGPLQARNASTPGSARVWLQAALPDLPLTQLQQRAEQTADNLSVSNAVSALRAIADADWTGIVARTSNLMKLMLTAPSFAAEDNATRDQTLHAIESLARRHSLDELTVASALLGLMAKSGDDQLAAHVAAHWLRGPGQQALMDALGVQAGWLQRWQATFARAALPAYLGAVVLGTAALVAAVLRHHADSPPTWLALLALLLMVFPASQTVVAIINRLISESLRPQHLPRLAWEGGIPADHRVIVVVPAMLTSAAATQGLVRRVELHYLANPERHAQFALLTDWTDADAAQQAGDAALLDDAQQQLRALNARLPAAAGDAPRFVLLHRSRSYSHSERRWIGWERKRGKLEQLIQTLAEPDQCAFIALGEDSRLAASTRYVVTLDSDTQLPPGRLRELVGVAAHPCNQPRLSADGRRVLSGFGILQPRVATPLPTPTGFTPFHWLFAGQVGIDTYSAATSEIYQDLFAEGSFTGKGLLHVGAVHAVLGRRLPQEQVLSHDLLEGALARCATVTDITVIEEAPFHADVAASRVHRWTRGDWQLLPFLLRPARWPMAAINRWKLFDNLRRSLVAPTSMALLLLSLADLTVSPWRVLALIFAASSIGPLMGAVAAFSPSRDDLAVRHFYARAAADLWRALLGGAWHLAMLLREALLAADAISRSLYRMLVSRRHLLQWTTSASAQAAAQTKLRALWREHAVVSALPCLFFAALLWAGTAWWPLAGIFCAMWMATPLWVWLVSRPRSAPQSQNLLPHERQQLQDIARDSWRLFERCVVAEDHHLPPDNLQTSPHDMVAHRTSPTNIGLYLLSAACAHQFGWLTAPQLAQRLHSTLDTLDKLTRHHGHFLNWYDTQTLQPLLPMYVSTVDSGNLCGHLLAVAQACRELAQQADAAPAQASEWTLLAQRCEKLAAEPEFGFLYSPRRHLLHIGYRVAEQQLDASFYDLLASEARLTSLWAIAKGDVPVRHWAALGRPFFAIGRRTGLRSWSGSMFEYLMPSLILQEPLGSVLSDACRTAVRAQINFARQQGVPWGISESAFGGRDQTLAYQYAPQGVPALALRRTPADELVVAPYATALAAQVLPRRALHNFQRLQQMGASGTWGHYGFIDALDFTAARRSGDEAFVPVATFMAHHQGMTIVALANVLLSGVARRWGMANAHIEAVVSLLHEYAPREVSPLSLVQPGQSDAFTAASRRRQAPGLLREVVPGAQAVEPTHVLSNGRYGVSLRANGAGNSRRGSASITRWRDDALRDEYGSFFFLRSVQQPQLVSLTQHPAPDPQAHYRSVFDADRVSFEAQWPGLHSHVTVWVSPEDDVEFRQVELRNEGPTGIDIELISAFEVVLADPRADDTHPAFSNLFVSAHWQADQQAMIFQRQPRLATEAGLHAAHFLTDPDAHVRTLRLQSDRQRWRGRGRPSHLPLAELADAPSLSDANNPDAERHDLITGLDPMCALSVQLHIAAGAKARVTFATTVCDDSSTLRAVVDKYRQPSHVQRASLMSATLTGIRLRASHVNPETFAAVQMLTTAVVHNLTRVRAHAGPATWCDKRLLWRFGVSGDRPIVIVTASTLQAMGLLRAMLQALRIWSWGRIPCDLVVLNAEPVSYLMPLQLELAALREQHNAQSTAEPGPPCTAMHVWRIDDASADELATLDGLARVHLRADGRPLRQHVQDWCALHEEAIEARMEVSATALGGSASGTHTAAAAALPRGSFEQRTGAFNFDTTADMRPAKPWINVLANDEFGAHISDNGGGYTWALNSRLNQLTAWSNDPVADTPSEWFVLQDKKSHEIWSLWPSHAASAGAEARWAGPQHGAVVHRVEQGQGHTSVRHSVGDLDVTATWCVDADSAVKQVRLQLTNRGHKSLQLRALALTEWMMGAQRGDRFTVQTSVQQHRVATSRLTALHATQQERAGGFGGGTAFLAVLHDDLQQDGDAVDWSCDRREFFDARGRLVLPDYLGQHQGTGLDPCAALTVDLVVAAGETVERCFLIGFAPDAASAQALALASLQVPAAAREAQVRARWDSLLGATQVKTPDPLFDVMVNRWLLYQTLSCRLWARAGFYQAGGAFGFRDQLQDAMAMCFAAPELLKQQILRSAARQFSAGDVQHWWHMPGGAGVRTRFSDDLLWLPHAALHYQQHTGDLSLWDEQVPFIDGPAVADDAEDAYYTPTLSAEQATVYEHGARAIDHSLRVGVHGLPLMGTGDWNDGMNRVGHHGRGESVWLGWFLCALLPGYCALAQTRGEHERAQRWQAALVGWRQALTTQAWDGGWFKRAFFDDGQPLGSHSNAEARIDLIAQAWSAISDAAPVEQQRLALLAMDEQLVDTQTGLIRLLHPPLQHALPSAGYIQAYPPGVRENGGQYSHGAVWALMAQAQFAARHPSQASDTDAPYRYFTYLSPAHRAAHPRWGSVYGIEPYVMAGDVYTHVPYAGRGGWSWYTGAAGWMHRAAVESILGLHWQAGRLHFQPCLPQAWPHAEITLRRDGRVVRFVLLRASEVAHPPDLVPAGSLHRRPGEVMHWGDLPDQGVVVVDLSPAVNAPLPGSLLPAGLVANTS
jgi:cyclic beta-1,2-glucan synthetase